MFWAIYISLLVGAGVLTYQFGVRGEGSFFSSLVAFVLWGYLAFQREIAVVEDGSPIVVSIEPSLRFLWAGLAVVAAFELLWQILGAGDSMTVEDNFAMER